MADTNDLDSVREQIARRAYERFCDRGCEHGGDMDDWVAAEREVLAAQENAPPAVATADDSPSRRNRKPAR